MFTKPLEKEQNKAEGGDDSFLGNPQPFLNNDLFQNIACVDMISIMFGRWCAGFYVFSYVDQRATQYYKVEKKSDKETESETNETGFSMWKGRNTREREREEERDLL